MICWLLWEAFPSPSPKALAAKAAPVLGVSERQVENYLGGHSDAKSEHVKKLLKRIKKFERLAQYIEGER